MKIDESLVDIYTLKTARYFLLPECSMSWEWLQAHHFTQIEWEEIVPLKSYINQHGEIIQTDDKTTPEKHNWYKWLTFKVQTLRLWSH